MWKIIQALLRSPGGKKAAAKLYKKATKRHHAAPKGWRGVPRQPKLTNLRDRSTPFPSIKRPGMPPASNRLTPSQRLDMRDAARRERRQIEGYERAMRGDIRRGGSPMQQDLAEQMRPLRREFSRTHPGTPTGIRSKDVNAYPGVKAKKWKMGRRGLKGFKALERLTEKSYNFPRPPGEWSTFRTPKWKKMRRGAKTAKWRELQKYVDWLSRGRAG
jgi:hypothetical protein